MNFDALKKRAKGGASELAKKLEAMNNTGGYTPDERIYKPGFDKSKGQGYAVVRFLPNAHDESGKTDMLQRYFFSFKGKNGYYNETSRKTLGNKEKDPVAYSNSLYFKLEQETGQKRPGGRNRREEYYANVYVIKDTVTPEHEGKVMVMKFGAQIFKKLQAKIKPEYDDEEPMDPFCVFNGADFKIKMSGNEIPDSRDPSKKVVVPNYESSEFARESEFMDGDEDKITELVNQTYDIREFVKVKEFDVLAARFLAVTGEAYDALEQSNPINEMAKSAMAEFEQAKQSSVTDDEEDEPELPSSNQQEDDDDDDILARFKAMAGE